MGMALEWMGIEGCRALALETLEGARERNGEIWAHCPWHMEKTPGNAFSYNYRKDLAKCHSCGESGDLISVWCACNSYPEKEGFIEFKRSYAKDASFVRPPKMEKDINVRKKEKTRDMPEAPAKWVERAGSFVMHSFERLMGSDRALEELERRWGIRKDTVLDWGIGMNDRDKWVPVTSWGLPYEEKEGKEKKIWLPKGLVIPCLVGDEFEVRKIKIRRSVEETGWGEKRKYQEVQGGENWRFHCYARKRFNPKIVAVIETERDAVVTYQLCDGSLGVAAGGGAAKRPCDPEVMRLIRGAEVLLVSLDTDYPGARNAVDYWLEEFGYAIHWPVPKEYGKDIGEAWKNGLDIHEWVMAGVPEYLRNKKRISVTGKEKG
ncbi:MAG: hypothetical protein JW882_14850 [Deltaproteobacteria bacterium]|nr:hypothetical protein [Deltaproteobacteria bacterium]